MLATLRIGARRISHAFLASVLFCALSPEGPEARETGQQFVDWVWDGISSVHASWWCGVRLVVAGAKVLAVAVLLVGWRRYSSTGTRKFGTLTGTQASRTTRTVVAVGSAW